MTRRQRSYPVAPPGLWDREDMRSALAARDMGAVITIFRRWTGASQTDIGVLLGMPQPHVSDFERGIRHATSLAMFERFADGLGIPRPLLGLAQLPVEDGEQEPDALRHKAPSPEAPVASELRCKRATGVGSLEELTTHEGDLHPWHHEYRPPRPSAPRSTSCSRPTASC